MLSMRPHKAGGSRVERDDGAEMARRVVGAVLASGVALGVVGLLPMVANAVTAPAPDAGQPAAAASLPAPADIPFDSSSLVLLLVAGGIGTMGFLSREPLPEREPSPA